MTLQVLRSITPLYALNRFWRSRQIKRNYRYWQHYYQTRAPALIRHHPRLSGGEPHILFIGTDEFQDRGGTIQALQQLGRVTLYTRSDGSYGQNDPDVSDRAERNSERLLQMFEEFTRNDEHPELIIAQTWSDYLLPEVLQRIKNRFGTIIINIGMDDRHRWNAIRPIIPVLDLALTAAPECVDWYEKEGCPCIYFPEASDPEIFHPMPELPKIHDVGFVGAKYGIREKIVLALREAGVNVTAYGNGWEGGRLAPDSTPKFFAQCKIILGVGTVGHCTDFYALKMRDFDAPMSGSFYLTHDNPDLNSVYTVGREIVTYRTAQQCVEKARYYLAHETEREAIAQAGWQRAAAEHTWQHRFATLLMELRS